MTLLALVALGQATETAGEPPGQLDVYDRVTHGYADSDGVRIHYAALGEGPLVVLVHGFPDFWYTWRHQMAELARSYQTVAIDLRGYNRSDKPEGVESYDMALLAGDVVAVIRHLGREKATVVGHDWGGAIAWTLAMSRPEVVERLIVLNLPHPRGLLRELAGNPEQERASAYAREFQKPDAHRSLSAEALAFWVTDPAAREKYVEAFRRSDFEAMLHYYKRNYPREPYPDVPLPKVQAPVLIIHGLNDPFLLPGALDGTWQWVEDTLTVVTVPGAGHFVQQDASELVTRTIKQWLATKGLGR
jgi:pimeloyl-ACP methyl ester carboxylesterase